MKIFVKLFLFGLFVLMASYGIAAEQSFKLDLKNLKISGTFPLNLDNPIVISGLDDVNQPFNVKLLSKKQATGIYQMVYQLDRNLKKEKSGSIVVQVGKKGVLKEMAEGQSIPTVLFEAMVTE